MKGVQTVIRRAAAPLGFLWLFKVAAAVTVALPLSQVVVAVGAGRFPDGDAVLWQPGGVYLVETLRLGRAFIARGIQTAFVIGALLSLVAQIPLAALLAALVAEAKPDRPRTSAIAPGFVFLGGLAFLAQGAVVAGAAGAALVTRSLLGEGADPRVADLCAAVPLLVGTLVILAIGVYEDLARAALALVPGPGRGALRPALRVLLGAPRAVASAWSARAALALGVFALASVGTALLDVGQAGGWRVLGAAAAHQVVIGAWVLLRADWLRAALEISQHWQEARRAPGGTAARSAAQADPS